MEELLNKLIEKGWRPRGEKVELYWTWKDTFWEKIVIFNGNAGWFKRWWCTYRELVSRESWLWQFVCENCMVKAPWHYWSWNSNYKWKWSEDRYSEYRLIESALCNKEELDKFLLDNIKVS